MAKILAVLTGGISSDGISSAWLSICKELRKKNSNVDQIDFLEIQEVSDENGVKKFKELGFNIISTPVRQSAPALYFKEIKKILCDGHYDVIHVNGSSSFMIIEMLAAKMEGIRLRIAHSHNTTCNNKWVHKLLLIPFNFLSNKKLACGVDGGLWLFGKSSFEIFHNGIDLDKFKFKTEIRKEVRMFLGLSDKTLAIGHVGKFNYQKNHEFLVKIFAEFQKIYPASMLLLFGDGELKDDIKQIADDLGITNKIIFMGVVNNIEYYLSGMDGMLLPSRFEGLPNVVVEWQANGLPSIISDSITKECTVSPLVHFMSLNDSPQLWAEKLIEIIEKKADRLEQSVNAIGKLKASGFDISKQVEKLLDIYNN